MSAAVKNQILNDKEYWKARHQAVATLEASGLQAVGVKANDLIYKMLAKQYKKLLDRIGPGSFSSVLDCGYGDGYFLQFFVDNFADKDVHGVDISPIARQKVKAVQKKNLHVGDLADFNLGRTYDLVHCFDVLYHVLDERNYHSALQQLAKHSSRYIALHERFFEKTPFITSAHVRMRRSEFTNQILNASGFFLLTEIPTHFFAMRMFSHKLNSVLPGLLYRLDNAVALNFPEHLQERLASHKIKIYQKAQGF